MCKLYRKKFWLRGRHEKNKVQSFATRAKILQIKNSKIKKVWNVEFCDFKESKIKNYRTLSLPWEIFETGKMEKKFEGQLQT